MMYSKLGRNLKQKGGIDRINENYIRNSLIFQANLMRTMADDLKLKRVFKYFFNEITGRVALKDKIKVVI